MDGWELLDRLYEDAELARLPKVVMTAWPRPVNLPQGVSVLNKPFEWDALLQAIRNHCGAGVAKCHAPVEAPPFGLVLEAAVR
jgi:CheY-like chemotaxis protein